MKGGYIELIEYTACIEEVRWDRRCSGGGGGGGGMKESKRVTSRTRVTSNLRLGVCFRVILLCILLKWVL